METVIEGKAYVLGDDIDTDQIIPAEHLVYNPAIPEERKMFGRYALSSVPPAQSGLPQGNVPFVQGEEKSEYSIIIAGKNFGCGSSREHAPLALSEAGIRVVVAEFYARIFFRNSVNGGYLIPYETPQRLVDRIRTGDEVRIDLQANTLEDRTTGETFALKPLGDILPILEAGDVFEYARRAGMLAR
jgi:3-isopropylmalate/(R)-2-methylmalate dehydratase small subunit